MQLTSEDDFQKASIEINGKLFENWTEIALEESIDGYSQHRFAAPFDPSNKAFRAAFRPFEYNAVKIYVGADVAFTGTMVDVAPEVDANGSRVSVSCYSKAGVLCDCTPDIEAPIEFSGMNLQQIATQIAQLYGIAARVVGDDAEERADKSFKKKVFLSPKGRARRGTPFERLQLGTEDRPHDFLADLARKRGLLLTDDENGNLLFVEGNNTVGQAVASLTEGVPPLLSITPQFEPQNYFSEITGYVPASKNKPGHHYTLPNPHMPDGIVRPHTFKLDAVSAADAPAAVRAKLGRMFANAISWTVTLPTWIDANGSQWRSNTTVKVLAPGSMIYRTTELLVRKCTRKQDANSRTTELNLVFTEAYAADAAIPGVLPWDETS